MVTIAFYDVDNERSLSFSEISGYAQFSWSVHTDLSTCLHLDNNVTRPDVGVRHGRYVKKYANHVKCMRYA